MDDRSFDRLARLLGEARDRRTGLKALAGGILGAGGLAALDPDADAKRKAKDRKGSGPFAAKKKRKTCKPACESGFDCVKAGRKRECVCSTGVVCGERCCAPGQSCVEGECRAAVCDPACTNGFVCEGTTCVCPSGVECGAACCAAGQTCQDGTCAGQPEPEPDTCIAQGQPCKAVGLPCCAGFVCASGQGGDGDVACYAPKTAACATTADCVYGTSCVDGRCAPPPPPPPIGRQLGAACNAATDVCTTPGAACTAYDGEHPIGLSGTYCTLPLEAECSGDPDCTCYHCWYPQRSAGGQGRREGRAARRKACCGPVGFACASDRDCCEDNVCSGGTCAKVCDVCAAGCAHTTVKTAIQAGLSEIRVDAGTYREYDLPLPGGSSVLIRACGSADVTIDARQQGRIMVPITTGKSVTFEGVTLTNGKGPATCTANWRDCPGGALRVESGGTLTLVRAKVSDSQAREGGGGIANVNGTLVLRDSIVTGCRVANSARVGDGYGGGVFSFRNPALSGTPSLSITGGEISYNQADVQGYGGGVSVWSGPLTMTDVHVLGNVTGLLGDGPGGGIEIGNGSSGTARLERCRFTGNHGQKGGAIFVDSGTVEFVGGEISGNVARGAQNIGGRGGGIHLSKGNLTLTDVTVTGNSALRNTANNDDAYGGGAFLGEFNATLRIAGSTRIADNTVEGTGAGIYNYGVSGNTVVCSGAAVSCSNPPANATGATNCTGNAAGGYTDCSTACVGGGPGGTSAGTCPA